VIIKAYIVIREVYRLGFNNAPKLIIELLTNYNFIALDYIKVFYLYYLVKY
jgi:hypothetical protein